MTGWLIDTTVLIDVSRGHADAVDFLEKAQTSETPLFVSVISAMELIVGCRDKSEVEKAKHLIADLELVQVSPVASSQAFELVLSYSKSNGLSIPTL